MLHMFDRLGLDPRHIPASNVVFVRSNGEAALAHEKAELLRRCWPVHQAVIELLGASTILCLGGTAGKWVRDYVGATELAGRFSETNARGWTSEAHLNQSNICVLTVTHPGRADWRKPDADPTHLVREMLAR
jgi:uracil-DNA glycosylase